MTQPPFPHLFSPLTVGGVTLKNRILSTGHMTLMVDDGRPSEQLALYHEARAAGGAGLIVTEAAAVHPSTAPMHITAFRDDCIPGYRRIAEACHAHDCPVFGQLGHGGRQTYGSGDGSLAVAYAPSALPGERFHVMPRAMSERDIADTIACYGAAAQRMKRAGLDGVEILASHAALPAQFLNPRSNLRSDAYGGGFENRLRFLRQVIEAVRHRVGADWVVGVRISGSEMEHDGLEIDEVVEACAALDGDGALDFLDVIAGSMAGLGGSVYVVPPMFVETGHAAPFSAAVKARVSIPVFVAGRINQPQIGEAILARGEADMCGMTRAMICDPEMAGKAEAGRIDDIRACIGCNQACIGHMQAAYPISCIQYPESGRERTYGTRIPAPRARKVLVAGGGPAGMKAAAVAAERGHEVTLYEAGPRLGGQALLAQLLPGRAEFGGIVTNLARELELAGARVVTDVRVTRDLVEREAPDAVVVATGATPWRPPIEGADEGHVVDAWQVLLGEANVGASVVVADWRCDWVGLGIAEKLALDGCRVRLCVNGTMAGQTIQQYMRDAWVGRLHKLGVEIIPYARLFGVDQDSVYLQHTTSGEAIVCEGVDTLVTALGHEAASGLERALESFAGEVHCIGDCLSPRSAEEAVLEGLKVAAAL